ncbi:DUF7504 family protein [Natronorubrum sp. FCH18a]|uniref:DUF7504 family protein n=1 Tax=Natronorubrum sp. FCH18a TaxID=3447018 RepID=UPI003F50E3BD
MAHETPYYLTFDDTELPSIRVIQSISAIVGAGRGELAPLHSVIDPEGLDRMGHSGNNCFVSFEYEGFHVTVHGDGKILLRDPESIHTTLSHTSNVLLLAQRTDTTELCSDLQYPYPPDRQNVLSIIVDKPADEKVAELNAQQYEMPAERKIISLGEFARSASAQSVTLPGPIEADLIADEQDLSTLYDRIEATLSDWESNSHMTSLCFDSVDALLDQIDLDTTFSFFYSLTSDIANSDTVAHYHLDPMKCDDETINILTPLFDAVISEDGDSTASLGA